MLKANARWVKDYRVDVDNDRGHSVEMDLPPHQMGTNTAASPIEYMVMGYAGCTVTMFKIVVDKMHLNVESIDISVEAQKPDDIQTISEMIAVITIKTKESDEKIEKALDMAKKMCPVGRIYEKAHIPAKIRLMITN